MARNIAIHGVPVTVSRTSSSVIGGGAVAGIIGGVLMAVFLMMYTGAMLGSLLAPLQLLGATFAGPEGAGAGIGVMLWGLIVHVVASAALGIAFAEIVGPAVSRGAALGWGIIYGIVVLLVMTYLVLPWANPVMFARVQTMMGAWFIAHVIFGIGVASTPLLVRRFVTPPPRDIPPPAV